jgi:drug/metabolite transporter (DMT)-like permease
MIGAMGGVGWVMAAAVGAAAGWGISDFLAGLLGRRMPLLTILIGSNVAAMLLALLAVAVRAVPPIWDARVWPAVIAGLLGLPAMGLLYRAMRDGSPAVVAPVAAVAALVPVGWGLLHGERLGVGAGLGVAAGLAGVTLASWPVPGSEARRTRRLASVYALGAALGLGTYFVLLHEAGTADQLWAITFARITEGVVALLLALTLRRRRDRPRLDGPLSGMPGLGLNAPVLAVGASDVLADAAFVASAAELIAPAAVIASLYPAVTLLLNRSFLRERLHTVHLYGVIAAVLSVACLAR